jgi:16S rRNA (guanine527-N7)-methyltransferase
MPSLATLLLVRSGEAPRVLDVGTGGGFPGIPLKILRPTVRLDLVEATRKKCRFLEACVKELRLEDTQVHWCRIEAPPDELRERSPFDLVVARAVGNETLLRRSVEPLLAPGAGVWTFTSPGESPRGALVWKDQRQRPLTALRRLP